MATSARSGGVVREVLRFNTGGLRAGGVVREIIRASTPQARISGVVREVLVQDTTSQVRTGGLIREALVNGSNSSGATRAYVDGLVREVLVFGFGPAKPVPPGQAKKHHVLAELDRHTQFEEEFFPGFTKRVVIVVPAPVPHIKSYHHVARYEEPEPEWSPLRRPQAIAPLPVPHIKPYHHVARYEEPEPEWSPLPRPQAIAPPPLPLYRPWRHGILFEDLPEAERRSFVPPTPPPPTAVVLTRPPPIFAHDEDEADWLPHRPFGFVAAPTPPPTPEITERYFIANMGRLMNRP